MNNVVASNNKYFMVVFESGMGTKKIRISMFLSSQRAKWYHYKYINKSVLLFFQGLKKIYTVYVLSSIDLSIFYNKYKKVLLEKMRVRMFTEHTLIYLPGNLKPQSVFYFLLSFLRSFIPPPSNLRHIFTLL